ncbi:MAG: ExbD/TolR family protein [Bacteriovoracia bacterium]
MGLKTNLESDLDENPIVAEINITPLTDVFLVLLIIFMVTSSVLSQMGIQVQLPKSSQTTSTSVSPGVVVTVTKSGEILINGTKVPLKEIQSAIRALLSKTQDKTVVLEGDKSALLGTVVYIMDEGKKAGAQKFAVATQSSDR